MPDQPIIIFCDNCGKGINLVARETIYQCKDCHTQVCQSCFNSSLKKCVVCASQIITKERQEKDESDKGKQSQVESCNSKTIIESLRCTRIFGERVDFLKHKLLQAPILLPTTYKYQGNVTEPGARIAVFVGSDYLTHLFRGKQVEAISFVMLVEKQDRSKRLFWGRADRSASSRESFQLLEIVKTDDLWTSQRLSISYFKPQSESSSAAFVFKERHRDKTSGFYGIWSKNEVELSPELSSGDKEKLNRMLKTVEEYWDESS